MAFCRPNWLNTCARTATSPSHEGVEGTAVGAIWIWIEGCVILFLCLLSREKDVILIFPLLRRHNFGLSCQFPDDLPPTNPGYAISLRMSWDAPDSFLPPVVVLGLTLSDNKKHTSHKPSGVGTDQRNHRGSTHAPSRSSATALHELLHHFSPLPDQ